jgi:two-component system response regulator GlrR
MSRRVLVVEDAASRFRDEFSAALNFNPEWVRWDAPFERLRDRCVDLMVLVAVPGCPEIGECFQWLAKNPVGTPTLAVLPPDGELMNAAAAVVDDFIVAPLRQGELQNRVSKLLSDRPDDGSKLAAHEQLTQDLALTGLIGKHPAFERTIQQIPVVARYDSPVLITGETGTGKELCGRAVHHLSSRRHLPFIPVDCAALPEHLFENEMFGHARGAFTDAYRDQKGLVALAGSGTLFLDEIDSLSLTAQSKLLRLLQERSYRPVGSDRFIHTDVKIVAASNQDLESLVEQKQFRSDLFFRLNVLRLHLSPLRERRSDIALLAKYFLDTFAAEHGGPRKRLSPAAMRQLTAHDWPGNVRELGNVLHRAAAFSVGPHVQPDLPATPTADGGFNRNFREERARAVAAFEKQFLEDMLRSAAGNVTRAAQLAGKDRRVFGRLMKRHNISRDIA